MKKLKFSHKNFVKYLLQNHDNFRRNCRNYQFYCTALLEDKDGFFSFHPVLFTFQYDENGFFLARRQALDLPYNLGVSLFRSSALLFYKKTDFSRIK